MRYMLMICTDENVIRARSPAEVSAAVAEFGALDEARWSHDRGQPVVSSRCHATC
jgi:hypothetical protein